MDHTEIAAGALRALSAELAMWTRGPDPITVELSRTALESMRFRLDAIASILAPPENSPTDPPHPAPKPDDTAT